MSRDDIKFYARKLRLPFIRKNLDAFLEEMELDQPGYEEFLACYLKNEYEVRCENSIQKRIQTAKFPYRIHLDEFRREHLSEPVQAKIRELETLNFIENNENLILIGNPGTGKSALSIALGMKACMKQKSVLFANVPNMLIEIKEAMSRNEITRYRQKFESYDLVILDELGYCTFDFEAGEVLFNLLSNRNEKGSIIVSSNLPLTKWHEVFRDKTLTTAMIDRLAYKAHMIDMSGDSYRIKATLEWMGRKE